MTSEPIGGKQSKEELALQKLIMDSDFERLEDLLAEFNLFDVLGIQKRELQHSAFLAWLLNPRGSHGLRDYFLRHFLSQAAATGLDSGIESFTPIDVDRWKLDDIDIATERHNIDILIVDRNNEFVCLIENKVGFYEHDEQLSRYLDIVDSEYEGLPAFPIFLTPDGIKPSLETDAERWVAFDYSRVANIIKRVLCMRRSTISASVASFLEQYERSLGRHVLETPSNIEQLARQIYDKHREAIDLIIKAKSTREVAGWPNIDAAIEEHAPDLCSDHHDKWYHRFYVPTLEEIPELKGGIGWTPSGRILLFEVRYRDKSLVLLIGPGPSDTRRRLYDFVQRGGVPGVDMKEKSRLNGSFHTVYSKRLIPSGSSYDLVSDQAKASIQQAVGEFYKNDYWPIVNAIREEFGLESISPDT
ncbi:MAG: hypothetical protein F4Z57_22860 [Gemmatimonadetes bacterium]|nr:hypothetical protein [Gemmatimonadota bacterium]MYC70015.1 hypothetical protein [Gemmatimonadota bacterium]MYI60885.1 hypothetical protein [Gemmatimonadota bacterium]